MAEALQALLPASGSPLWWNLLLRPAGASRPVPLEWLRDGLTLPLLDRLLALALRNKALHRNFMGYTTRKQTDLVGFGVSAISQVGDCYAQNAKDLPAWTTCVQSGKPATVRGLRTHNDDRWVRR